MKGRRRGGRAVIRARATLRERRVAQIAIALAEQIEEHDRGRNLLSKQLHARRGRVKAQLQRIEVEAVVSER